MDIDKTDFEYWQMNQIVTIWEGTMNTYLAWVDTCQIRHLGIAYISWPDPTVKRSEDCQVSSQRFLDDIEQKLATLG